MNAIDGILHYYPDTTRDQWVNQQDNWVHCTAQVSSQAILSGGSLVGPDVTIEPHVRLGYGCWIDRGSRIRHGASIGAGTNVGPMADIGESTYIGESCRIGKNVHIGGMVVAERCVLIDRDTVVNHNVTIGSMSRIGNMVNIMPDVSVGSRACIRDRVTLLENVQIGMGAEVTAGSCFARTPMYTAGPHGHAFHAGRGMAAVVYKGVTIMLSTRHWCEQYGSAMARHDVTGAELEFHKQALDMIARQDNIEFHHGDMNGAFIEDLIKLPSEETGESA